MALRAEQATKGTIHISARRWFHKGPGNTYHSVSVTMPNGRVLTKGMTYGYGSQYEYTAWNLVTDALGLPKQDGFSPWRWYEAQGHHVVYDVVDVPRKKDLHIGA